MTDVTDCNFTHKGTFYCVVSFLLCWAPWTVVAFTWEMGLVASLGSISQLAVSLIQSRAVVLALQYQSYSSRGLLCEERKSVIILRPQSVERSPALLFGLPLAVSTWQVGLSGTVNSTARLALSHWRYSDGRLAPNSASGYSTCKTHKNKEHLYLLKAFKNVTNTYKYLLSPQKQS